MQVELYLLGAPATFAAHGAEPSARDTETLWEGRPTWLFLNLSTRPLARPARFFVLTSTGAMRNLLKYPTEMPGLHFGSDEADTVPADETPVEVPVTALSPCRSTLVPYSLQHRVTTLNASQTHTILYRIFLAIDTT